MDQFGNAIRVEDNQFPYENSHMLSSNLPSSNLLLPYHNITVNDIGTPMDDEQLPVFLDGVAIFVFSLILRLSHCLFGFCLPIDGGFRVVLNRDYFES